MSPSSVPKNPPAAQARDGQSLVRLRAVSRCGPSSSGRANARVASFVLLHLEYWELIPDESSYRDPRPCRRVRQLRCPTTASGRSASMANRTGIFRVLDVLDRYQIRGRRGGERGWRPERYPYPHRAVQVSASTSSSPHGHSANRMIHLEDERGRGEDRDPPKPLPPSKRRPGYIQKAGWARTYGESQAHAPSFLADAGLDYGDRLAERRPAPIPMKVGKKFVSMPNQAGMGPTCSSSGCGASPPHAIPTWSARLSNCCITRAARCSTCRSILG